MDKTISRNEQDTQTVAKTIAGQLTNKNQPVFIFLTGPLGAGKSVFARALIRTLCDDPDLTVPSPTFTLVQTYDSASGPLYHYDLYRLKAPTEIYELGWEESLSEGISIIEWPDRLAGIAPVPTLDIHIEHADNTEERIIRCKWHDSK
jgi:tRNA threonylcarbamoyl adenosine modification protein YjeE